MSGHAPQVRPGDNIWTDVDKLLTHDVCGPGTFGIFQNEFGMDAEVGALLLLMDPSGPPPCLSTPLCMRINPPSNRFINQQSF